MAAAAASEVLVRHRLAARGPGDDLLPGPDFVRWLTTAGAHALPMATLPTRGEVRVEVGVWRCYPDPGPQGFDTDPVNRYLATCPGCGTELTFFALRFPYQDPLAAACSSCGAQLLLLELSWHPALPMGRMEITFGDLDTRPSLRGHPVFDELEAALGTRLREAHVTL